MKLRLTVILGLLMAQMFSATVYAGDASANRAANEASEDIHPAWSSDGSQIVFSSNRSGNFDIWLMSADGSNPVNLTDGTTTNEYDPQWSPDGSQIAFYSMQRNASTSQLVVIERDGEEWHTVYESGESLSGKFLSRHQWSPDGQMISFSAEDQDYSDIMVLDLSTRSLTNLTESPRDVHTFSSWSPDSRLLAFISISEDESRRGIWMAEIESGTLTHIRLDSQRPYRASWSPDGATMVVAALFPDFQVRLSVISPDGTYVDTIADGTIPEWSPSGEYIAYHVLKNDDMDIWVTDITGENMLNLTGSNGFLDQNPSWSPDSDQIAFESNRDGSWDIWIVNVDGSNPMNLTVAPAM